MHVYLDDSESLNGNGLICLAGYAAYDDSWQEFANEWVCLLNKYNLPPETNAKYLHTAEFMAAEGNYSSFKCLGKNGRIEIIKEFILVIRRYIEFGIAVAVDSAAYLDYKKNNKDKDIKDPRQFCLYRVIKLLMTANHLINDGEIVSIVCDEHHSAMHLYGAFASLRKDEILRNRLGSITFADDRFFQPLQAADLLACITLKEQKKIQDEWTPTFAEFSEILKTEDEQCGIHYLSELWDAEEIRIKLMKDRVLPGRAQ
jgi:hypothetical protein